MKKEMAVNRRETVKKLAKERKHKLVSWKVLHQFLWDINEVDYVVTSCVAALMSCFTAVIVK